jgi:cytosine/adenosine deaminase-related metal-dependent hydrolase
MSRLVIEGCSIATVDRAGTEHDSGHVVLEGNRIAAVGAGPADPSVRTGAEIVDGSGCLATPGLVNCHHHLYQWLTRGMAQEANLFEWLTALYPLWAHIDEEVVGVAAAAGLAALAASGCSTTTDHHYVWPRGGGDLLAPEIEAARKMGVRFHPCRGSMDLGASSGGLPPDEVTEDTDDVLAATDAAIDRWHDPSFGSMLRIAVAPCSPFSATGELMRASAELARARGVRLHTHLAETIEEESFCLERFGIRPVSYLEDLGWLGDDVWLAHCVHLSTDEVTKFGRTRTGVAHCPSSNARLGAGIAPVAQLLSAGGPVGLGVDGAASNEAGELGPEMRQALLFARLAGGTKAMRVRTALEVATREGARCLGREEEIGSLEPGKLADIALWRLDDPGHGGITDPVAALVLGPRQQVDRLIVDGATIVDGGVSTRVDAVAVAHALEKGARRLVERAGGAR